MVNSQKLDKLQIAKLVNEACVSKHFQSEYKNVHRDYDYCGSFSDEFGDYAIDVKVYKDKVKFMVYYEFDFLQHFSVTRDKIDRKLGCFVKQEKVKGLIFTKEQNEAYKIIVFDSADKFNETLNKDKLSIYLQYKGIDDVDELIKTFNNRNRGKQITVKGDVCYEYISLFYRIWNVTYDSISLVYADNVVIYQIRKINKTDSGYDVRLLIRTYKHIINSKFENKLRFIERDIADFRDIDNRLIRNIVRTPKIRKIFDSEEE